MAETFEGLGLRSELVGVAREVGFREPTAIQSAAIPVLRRGGNALVHAAPGAGTLAAYGLAILDRLSGTPDTTARVDESDQDTGEEVEVEAEATSDRTTRGLRALIVVPTAADATRSALSLARLARGVDLSVAALVGGWSLPEETGAVDILFVTPALLIEAVENSRLKLDGVEAFVLDDAASIIALGGDTAVETVTTLIPRDSQRVIITGEMSPAVEDYAERHLRRALRIPPVPVEGRPMPGESEPTYRVDYQVVSEWEKEEVTAALLAKAEPGRLRIVYCRNGLRVSEVSAGLELRGFSISDRTDPGAGELPSAGVIVAVDPIESPADALVVSIDPPFDSSSLTERHERGGTLVVSPRELTHLRQISGEAGFELRLMEATPALVLPELTEYRTRLRTALAEEDISAQLLILDPLFREFSPAEVAAAASALLRRRPSPVVEEREGERVRSEAGPALVRPSAARVAPAPAPAYVRLFVGVGSRDGVVPSDLVGAITGEAQVRGAQVGRIEIRDTFSIVEVESEIAPRVIQAVNGITLKGRSVRVDFDRRGSAPTGRGGPERGRGRIPRRPRERP